MNFHVDSRGVTFNLGFLAGEGLMFKLFNKTVKFFLVFPRSLRSLDFYIN